MGRCSIVNSSYACYYFPQWSLCAPCFKSNAVARPKKPFWSRALVRVRERDHTVPGVCVIRGTPTQLKIKCAVYTSIILLDINSVTVSTSFISDGWRVFIDGDAAGCDAVRTLTKTSHKIRAYFLRRFRIIHFFKAHFHTVIIYYVFVVDYHWRLCAYTINTIETDS